MPSLGDLIVKVGADISGFTSAMSGMIAQLDEQARKIEKSFDGIEAMGKRVAAMGAGLSIAITAPLAEIGKSAVETAAQFEVVQVAFTTLTGSAGAAKDQLAELYQFASETPFQIQGILQGTRTLLAMQFAAKDVVPILRTLGDAASGLGLGQEGLERLVFHLGQIKSEGTIDGKVLRELGQMGINAGQMLANGLGKSVPDIRKMIHDKAIDATTAINALLAGMNANFGGMMAAQMGTLTGMWTNLKDNLTITLAAIGDALLPLAKKIVEFGVESLAAVKTLAVWFENLPKPIQYAALAVAGLAAAMGPLLLAAGGLMIAIGPMAALLGVTSVAFLGWGVAIGAAITALVALGTWVSQHWEGIKATVAQGWSGVKDMWNATLAVPVAMVLALFQKFSVDTSAIWNGISSTLSGAFNIIGTAARAWWSLMKNEVFDPLFQMIEKIPGVAKLLTLGDAFKKADAEAARLAKQTAELGDALKLLKAIDSGPFKLTDQGTAWKESHQKAIQAAQELEDKVKAGYARGAASADDLARAHKHLLQVMSEKMPDFSVEKKDDGSAKAAKLSDEQSRQAKEIDGEVAHSKALMAIETDRAKFLFDTREISELELISRTNEIAARELAIEQSALVRKRAIYEGHVAQQQGITDQIAALSDKMVLHSQQAWEKMTEHLYGFYDRAVEVIQNGLAGAYAKSLQSMRDWANAQTEVTATMASEAGPVGALTAANQKLDAAFKTIGGESTNQLLKRLKELQEAYKAVRESGVATPEDLRKAWIALEETRQKAIEGGADGKVTSKQRLQLSVEKDNQAGGAFKNIGPDMWKATESSFNSAIDGMIRGTQTFSQAWGNMGRNILASWENSLLQMGLKWIAHKAAELALHLATNTAKTASDATAVTAEQGVSIAATILSITRAAAVAAANTFASIAAIPIVGPELAPAAAAASFAEVMSFAAFSAQGGADLPDANSIGFLHPREMVLPRNLADGMRNIIANGGTGGGSRGDSHFHGDINYHAAAGESLSEAKVVSIFKSAMRSGNMQLA